VHQNNTDLVEFSIIDKQVYHVLKQFTGYADKASTVELFNIGIDKLGKISKLTSIPDN